MNMCAVARMVRKDFGELFALLSSKKLTVPPLVAVLLDRPSCLH